MLVLLAARPVQASAELPPGYALSRRGLVWRDPSDADKPELHLAGPFEVLAETRDGEGGVLGRAAALGRP